MYHRKREPVSSLIQDYVVNIMDNVSLANEGKEGYYDYILASHLIEHTTDFIGFLKIVPLCSKKTG